ncbi:hypothetical protein [Streptomyces yangpuensis]|uniref:hypothetical protein n=1 Tax=Streptomyces yangpuensis TaxID=1648182 RepID=UPI0037F42B11
MINPTSICLPEFLAEWYGPSDRPAVQLPPECSWLPGPLKEWYAISSQWSVPLSRVKRFVDPESITPIDGKAIFLEDGTGDWRWSFDVECPDVVYDAELYGEWRRNSESLERLILHSVVHDAIWHAAATYRCNRVPERLMGAVLEPVQQIDFAPWEWPAQDYLVFMGDRMLIDTVPDYGPPGFFQVQVAAADAALLEYLDHIPEINWRKAVS